MVKFYNAADQKLYEQYKFLPQEQYRLGLNLPTSGPTNDPVVDEGIVNTNAFANSGGGNDFNPAGNMFGEGTAVNPVYGGNPITGGFDGGYGVDPVTGDLPGGGNIVDEFGTEGEVYSKGAFDSLKGEDKKKFLSKMRTSFNKRTENLPDWAKKGLTAAGMITSPAVTILGKIFGGGSGGDGGSYGIAGLTDQQKSMYNNLAASGFLYETPSGYKTKTGKNFTGKGYKEGQQDIYNEMVAQGYDMDDEGNITKNGKSVDFKGKSYLKNKIAESFISGKNNTNTNTNITNPNITNPNITTNMINEFAATNNDSDDKKNNAPTTPGFGTTPQGNYTNQFDGGDPGQGQGNNEGNQNQGGNQNDNSPGSQGPGGSDEMGSFARGGRAGYFFGGRAGYAEGGPIYSRLGTLSSGVQSAEQQLQGINASLQKAESDLGSDSPGGGSSLAGGPSFTSNFEDANNQGPGSNLLFGGSMDNEGMVNQIASPTITAPKNTFNYGGNLAGDNSLNNTIAPFSSIGGGKITGGPQQGRVPGNPELAGPVISSIGGGRIPGGNKGPESIGGGLGGQLLGGAEGEKTNPISSIGGVDPYKNTMISGLSQDGQRFDSAQNAFDALVEQTRKYREKSPYTRNVIGSERYRGEEGFKNFTNYFNEINDPSYSAPQLQSLGGGLGSFAPGVDPMGSRKENPTGPLQSLGRGIGSIL